MAPAPAIPGGPNWTTIGPSLIERGQALGRPSISGRVAGIAISADGQRIYVASANGGVWRSNDAGANWQSTMDSFDTDPTAFATTSQACGAIAIAPNNANRVYVGTGEGNTDSMFQQRIVNSLPAYRGIGPVMSNDGGQTWVVENSEPPLAGFSYFEIAVDPANPEHCVAATTNGLYERVAAPGGGFKWVRRRTGVHCSVVVARAAGVTRFFAAVLNSRVVTSTNGTAWSTAGTGISSRQRRAYCPRRAAQQPQRAVCADRARRRKAAGCAPFEQRHGTVAHGVRSPAAASRWARRLRSVHRDRSQ